MSDIPNADPGETGDGADDPQYVTKEDLNDIVNRAITGHTGRLEKRLGKSIAEAITALRAQDAPEDDGDDDDVDPDQPKAKAKPNPQVQRQLTRHKNELKALQDKLESRDKAARDARLETAVTKSLGEAGLNGRHLRGARAFLYQEGKVFLDDDGSELFMADDGTELDLKEGMKEWLDSDDAKLYQPPRGASGSGDRGGKAGSSDPKDRKLAAAEFLQRKLFEG